MLHDFVLLKNLVQNVQRPPAVNHEILRDDFKPVDDRLARENVLVMWRAQANPDPISRKPVKAIRTHRSLRVIQIKEGRQASPALSQERSLIPNWWLGRLFLAVGPAAALALARVFALTSVPVLLVLGLLRLLVLVLILIRGTERSLQ